MQAMTSLPLSPPVVTCLSALFHSYRIPLSDVANPLIRGMTLIHQCLPTGRN
jgi:hypothetical protein